MKVKDASEWPWLGFDQVTGSFNLPTSDIRSVEVVYRGQQTSMFLRTEDVKWSNVDRWRVHELHTPHPPKPRVSAPDVLQAGADALRDRAAQRDQPGGERSMARAVAAFNAMYGTQLTTVQGWQFMVLLKMSRAASNPAIYRADDYVDQSAYSALAGEEHGNG